MSTYLAPTVGNTELDRSPRPAAVTHPGGGSEAAGNATEQAAAAEKVSRVQPVEAVTKQADIRLRFLVDARSKEVTVLVVDRASQSVIRTIPPNELSTFKAGDLVELFA